MADVEQVLITAARRGDYGGIIADAVFSESAEDEIVITEHPVEKGAIISDHAFKRPAIVVIQCGWTNSGPQSNGDEGYVLEIYDRLLALQVSYQPINITTGKRVYSDMLIRRLTNETNNFTEFSLPITMTCQQVIMAEAESVQVPSDTRQASPQKTAPVKNSGPKQPLSAPGFVAPP